MLAESTSPSAVTSRVGSTSLSAGMRNPRSGIGAGGRKILAPLRARGLGRLPKVDHHPATGVAAGNGLLQLDLGIAEIAGGDLAEHVGGHHAHAWPPDHLFGEGAGAVAQDDLVFALLDDEKITL